jgi:hypothetical protein
MEETPGGHREELRFDFNEIAMNDETKVVGADTNNSSGVL